MGKLTFLLKKIFISSVKSFWGIPGIVVEFIVVIGYGFALHYGPLSNGNVLQIHSYGQNTLLFCIFLPSIVFFIECLVFLVILLVTMVASPIIRWIYFKLPYHSKTLRYVLSLVEIPNKMCDSKIIDAFVWVGLVHPLAKFIVSLVVGLIVKISPFILFSLSPHREIKISQKVREKIEHHFWNDAKKWKWSYFRFDLIRAISDNRLPKGNGAKQYGQLLLSEKNNEMYII